MLLKIQQLLTANTAQLKEMTEALRTANSEIRALKKQNTQLKAQVVAMDTRMIVAHNMNTRSWSSAQSVNTIIAMPADKLTALCTFYGLSVADLPPQNKNIEEEGDAVTKELSNRLLTHLGVF
ncbi:hypothetical protein KIPB_003422 [Kipferlia bialata]|uniref:Uncharacterized protein n=1 Tax=Kipferlia bialata TaxID=797122 RepID=A0A9K3CVE5_9EUKA|nr:hypothetical protein KIPB_003422 [Kipferlia bialata]|eukprot:g3422.t1